MKKTIKHFVAACAMLAMLSSCGILNQTAAQGSTLGTTTGTALSTVIKILKSTGVFDLSNLGNLINLGKILTGASSLQNASSDFVNEFASGLITGSSNMINQSNVTGVMSALKSLANTDTSVLMNAATAADAGQPSQLTSSSTGVQETLAVLNNICALIQ